MTDESLQTPVTGRLKEKKEAVVPVESVESVGEVKKEEVKDEEKQVRCEGTLTFQ